MNRLHYFHQSLFRKVLYFEWALLGLCALGELFAWRFAPPDPTAPNLGLSLALLCVVFSLSFVVPVKHNYWDRMCFLFLELMLLTGATAAGLARFVFPLYMVTIAKACLMLDRRGLLIVGVGALISQILYASYKIMLTRPELQSIGFPSLMINLIGGSLITTYAAITLMVLVAMLTLSLVSEQKSRLETERLSREVETLATELERTRIAREIHDSLGHTLTSLNIQLDVARKFKSRDPDRSGEALELAKELASQSLKDVRMAIQSIRDAGDFNFGDSVQALVGDLQHTHKIDVDVNVKVSDELPAKIAFQLYRVIQECLTNVVKHAHASKVFINVEQGGEQVEVNVADNGRGLQLTALNSGFGLRGMQERVESLNGTVGIKTELNQGTAIQVTIPL